MTRLTEEDIKEIPKNLSDFDKKSVALTGYTIEGLARLACNFETGSYYDPRLIRLRVAVVPTTCGQGIIAGFSETVCAIFNHCGVEAYPSRITDIAGIKHALDDGNDMVFVADDNACILFMADRRAYSENGWATGIGFAAALECMSNSPTALVLGAGPVGCAAARHLKERGREVVIYDIDEAKMENAACNLDIAKESDPDCFKRYTAILDATDQGDFIEVSDTDRKTVIAAPGVPLGVKREVAERASVYFNPLELGVATMLYDCLSQCNHQLESKERKYYVCQGKQCR